MIRIARFETDDAERLFPLLDAWIAVHRALPLRPDYREAFARWIADMKGKDNSAVFVAQNDSEAVGMVIGNIWANGPLILPEQFGYINILVVLPGFRKKGLGRNLWKTFETWCLGRGVDELHLYTLISNEQARRFWQGQKFEALLEMRIHLPEDQSGTPEGKNA